MQDLIGPSEVTPGVRRMNQTVPQIDPELEAERRLLEAAVAEARADPRPGVPHEQVRADLLREIERLNRKISGH